jgi:hypothetical protein
VRARHHPGAKTSEKSPSVHRSFLLIHHLSHPPKIPKQNVAETGKLTAGLTREKRQASFVAAFAATVGDGIAVLADRLPDMETFRADLAAAEIGEKEAVTGEVTACQKIEKAPRS